MATYAQGYVVVLIGTIVFLNLIILKQTFLRKTHMEEIIDNYYNQQKEFGTKETHAMFLYALFTSWVSPCTVWTSNALHKSKFLIVSGSITLSVHMINLINLYLIADSNRMDQIENPPILHCFKSHKNFSSILYNYYYPENLTNRLINLCKNDADCLSVIRICFENEMPNTLMNTYIIPIAILLLVTSFSASMCLQTLSNYSKLFSLSRKTGLACSKTFYWFVLDFVFSLDKSLNKKVLDALQKGVTKDVLNPETFKKLFSHHHEYFEKSEETKSLYSKLEEISKENERNQDKFSKELPQVVWKLPPMHAATYNNKFGLWCFMYILGGEAGALNGQAKSSINLIMEKFKIDKYLFRNCNLVSRNLIKTAAKMYGEYALHKATRLGDLQLMKMLIANGYDIDEPDNHYKIPLLYSLETQNNACLRFLLLHVTKVEKEKRAHADSFESDDDLKILLQTNINLYEIGKTLLYKAISSGKISWECRFECIKYLADNKTNKDDKTLLHISAKHGDLECIKYLIDNKADVNVKDDKGQTPLHISARRGDLKCLKYLIDNKADVNVKDEGGQNVLHIFAWRGHLECLKYLIENKADVNAKDKQGQTPLHISTMKSHLECVNYLIANKADVHEKNEKGQTLLHMFASKGNLVWCKYLIDNKVDVNAKDEKGQTPLHNSTKEGHLECSKYLIKKKADFNSIDKCGQAPPSLHIFAESGDLEIINYLIDNKVDVNLKNEKGQTALHIVSKKGDLECIKYLIDNNADVNAKDKNGQNALHISAMEGHLDCIKYLIENKADVNAKDNYGQTPLHKSVWVIHLESIKHLIVNNADVNAKDDQGQTPLHISAWESHLDCLKYLIDNNANVNAKDDGDQTPLHISARRGHLDCIKFLFDNKADVNAKDKDSQAPLHQSVREGHLECCKYLIDNKADVNAKDKYGLTPLHEATKRGHLDSMKNLIDNKADINVMDLEHNTPLHLVGKDAWLSQIECAEFLIRAGADLNASNVNGKTPMKNHTVKQLKLYKPELFIRRIEK